MQGVQYITDPSGKKTAVIVPIADWDAMQKEMEYSVPNWHKEIVLSRLDEISEPGKDWNEVKANLKRKA